MDHGLNGAVETMVFAASVGVADQDAIKATWRLGSANAMASEPIQHGAVVSVRPACL